MKTFKLFEIIVLSLFMSVGSFGQMHDHSTMASNPPTKTSSFKVWGNCEMCKAKIEKAAKIESVSKASWDKETEVLTLVYNPTKEDTDLVLKKIAAEGYDTEKFKADEKSYKSLPACCQYERE
jgi:periplasmic mercuric ion binding protein